MRTSGRNKDEVFRFGECLPFLAILLAVIAGMGVDVFEVDAAQYAHISRTLSEGGSWVQFFDLHRPYLDKPPLIFWMTAASFKIFGASNISYRFPSILFFLVSTFALYRLGKKLSGHRTGWLAALIFSSSQGVFLMNLDVKTDMYLIAGVTIALWKLAEWHSEKNLKHALGFGFGIALGLLAKGPIGALIPLVVAGGWFLADENRMTWFHSSLLAILPVVFLLLAPMVWGLWLQFGADGPKFFFWTQSFGRITGESKWSNDAGPFFLAHTFLWAFLPWTAVFIPAIFEEVKGWKTERGFRTFILTAFIFPAVALSLSRFKLPHYIFIVLPAAALITARWLKEKEELQAGKRWSGLQGFIIVVCLLIPFILVLYAFPGQAIWPWLLYLAVLLIGMMAMGLERKGWTRLVLLSATGVACGNILLNGIFFREISKYQANAMMMHWANESKLDMQRIGFMLTGGHSTAFYSPDNDLPGIYNLDILPLLKDGPRVFFVNERVKNQLNEIPVTKDILNRFPNHSPGKLTLPFLNPETRATAVDTFYAIRCGLLPQ